MEEDEELQKYLQENITIGKVFCSCTATTASILFVHEKDESLTLYLNYRALNNVIVPNKYPLLLIGQSFDKTKRKMQLLRLDLTNVCNFISIGAGDNWKTAFHTKEALLWYIIVPFGLTTIPTLF